VNIESMNKVSSQSPSNTAAPPCPTIGGPNAGAEQDATTAEELLKAARAELPGQAFAKGAQCVPLEELLKWLLQSRQDVVAKQAAAVAIMRALAASPAFRSCTQKAFGCSLRRRWEVELRGSQHLFAPLL
jgi:hypothetical protein